MDILDSKDKIAHISRIGGYYYNLWQDADHVAGMDDLRRFCDLIGGNALTVYSTEEGMGRVLAMYPYAMAERPIAKGYAAFKLVAMPTLLDFPEGTIQSTLLPHGGVNTLGLVFTERSSGKKFVYYTDCKTVPTPAVNLALDCDLAILDGLRPNFHPTHMTYQIDYATYMKSLAKEFPKVGLCYDGLRIQLG